MNKLLAASTGIAVLIALLIYHRHSQTTAQRALAQTRSTLEETEARAEGAEFRSEKFKRELLKLQAEQLLKPVATATGDPAKEPEEHPAAKLFRDPEMRSAMRREHVNAVEQNVKRIVDSNLVQRLNLTPEQAATLKDLVRTKHAPGVDLMMALMSNASDLPQIGRAAQRERDEADAEIRSFLGDSAYATYDAYEDSLAERLQLSRFCREDKSRLTFTPEQEESLLQAMIEERQNFQFTHDFHDPLDFDMDRLPEIFSEESLNQLLNEMEQLNSRIIVRAQSLLGPEASAEFAQALRDHFEKSKITVRMTNALFPVGGRRRL